MLEKEKKIKKKTLGNYPFLSVIFSVSLSLFLIGIFSILLISSYKMKLNIQKKGITSRFETMLEEQSLVYAVILVIFSIVFSLISNWLFRRR